MSFVRFEKGRFVIDPTELLRLYGQPKHRPQVQAEINEPVVSERVMLSVTLSSLIEAVTSVQQERLIDRLLAILKFAQSPEFPGRLAERLAQSLGFILVKAVTEGCTTIKIEVSRAQADEIVRAFRAGGFDDIGVIAVDEAELKPGASVPNARGIDPGAQSAKADFAKAWRAAARREMYVRPWRRLRWLFSPSVRLSPLAHVIGESDDALADSHSCATGPHTDASAFGFSVAGCGCRDCHGRSPVSRRRPSLCLCC